jgi:plasmid stabilization system protein ParE
VKVRFSPRAQRRVKLVVTWWRKNRPSAPTLFRDELEAVIEMLRSQPMLGAEYQVRGGEILRRTLLKRSAQHVYYSVDEANDVIVIYSVWGARRGRGPKL